MYIRTFTEQVANYAADGGCLDNDDGSSYYNIHHNYCVYGGTPLTFDRFCRAQSPVQLSIQEQ